ncbi:MAG: phenylalanine--tRNA ligase subunit beta [Planctomycetota bacterium]|nr:phenylalanine--tRNA ligase subunit beta [Planctomycetota bacterium]
MKLSYRWLARHVDLTGASAVDIAKELTLSTAEVEGVEPFLPHLSDVTIGHVLEREKHPDADKLSVCKVDVGAGEPLQIVCGAPNVRAGLTVAVATAGTALPGDFKIKKSKIRGVESNGMICSERELGLGLEHDGIWELPAGSKVGTRVADALGLGDWVIEIDNKSVTHRPDLWGHRGIAAELAAILRRPLKPLDFTLPAAGTGTACPVRIESDACSRYMALVVEGARATRSPLWLKSLLLAVGQRPIDLLVDLSNFVMLDLGQPNHLFDARKIGPQGIVVRKAREGETLKTLDELERKLGPSDLLICNGDEPVALAGIMGGDGSKVEGDTSRLVLEVAAFHAPTVRRTSSRLALRTDASARFEKTLDPELVPKAAAHLVRLLQTEQPEVRIAAPVTDVGTWKSAAKTIRLRGSRVRQLLGAPIDDAAITDTLVRLGFGVKPAGDALEVSVPSIRATKDIGIEQDLVEEVGRIFRYGNVPEQPMTGALVPPPRDERRRIVRAIEDRLAGSARFRQQISYSFVPDALVEKLALNSVEHVQVQNPITDGASRVRRSVATSLLALLEPNRRRVGEVRLFEVGKGYVPQDGDEPKELHEVALALARPARAKDARFDDNALSTLESVVEDLVRSLGLEATKFVRCEAAPTWAHPGRAVALRFGEAAEDAGVVAMLEPGLARALGLAGELESDVAVALLSIDALLAAPVRARRYTPVPQFPATRVDVALALPEDRPAGEVKAKLEACGKGLVGGLELFDVFAGERLGAGRKSLAWHVTLQAPDRTLNEADVKKFLERVERAAGELGGELRRE